VKETNMSSQGERRSQHPVSPGPDATKPQAAGPLPLEQQFKSIGIGAVASALSILKPRQPEPRSPRQLPGFLAREDIAA
jgi:hypothetical protein